MQHTVNWQKNAVNNSFYVGCIIYWWQLPTAKLQGLDQLCTKQYHTLLDQYVEYTVNLRL
jgi:hypothetical protein